MKERFIRKRCPKCGGNVFLHRDFHGWYEECLQCGHISNLPDLVEGGAKDSKDVLGQAIKYSANLN